MIPFFDHTPAAPKICGITTLQDALGCISAGAGALGFNFYHGSPRVIEFSKDLPWITSLKQNNRTVAFVVVVVNPDTELLNFLEKAACFDAIQFHGYESPQFCANEGSRFPRWIKVLRIRSGADMDEVNDFATPFFLLDATLPGAYGGSGQVIDWDLGARVVAAYPKKSIILAGGLNPKNVEKAVQCVRPHAVDVASGVECTPRMKNLIKVRQFITAADRQKDS